MAQALFDKGNPVLLRQIDARAQGEARTLLDERALEEAQTMLHLLLQGRGIAVDADTRAHIAACSDLATLQRWAVRAARVTSARQLFADGDHRRSRGENDTRAAGAGLCYGPGRWQQHA